METPGLTTLVSVNSNVSSSALRPVLPELQLPDGPYVVPVLDYRTALRVFDAWYSTRASAQRTVLVPESQLQRAFSTLFQLEVAIRGELVYEPQDWGSVYDYMVTEKGDSAPGYPWNQLYKKKRDIPRDAFLSIIASYLKLPGGSSLVWKLFFKDELIKRTKAAEGRYRMICNPPFELFAHAHRLHKAWHEARFAACLTTPYRCGINVHSPAWHALGKFHAAGVLHLSLDLSGAEFQFQADFFDWFCALSKALHPESVAVEIEHLCSFLRSKLVMGVDGRVQRCDNLNPSGHYDTTTITDLFTLSVVLRYVQSCGLRVDMSFLSRTRLSVYGDNLLWSLQPEELEAGLSYDGFMAWCVDNSVRVTGTATPDFREARFLSQGWVLYHGVWVAWNEHGAKLLASMTLTKTRALDCVPGKHASKTRSIMRQILFCPDGTFEKFQGVVRELLAAGIYRGTPEVLLFHSWAHSDPDFLRDAVLSFESGSTGGVQTDPPATPGLELPQFALMEKEEVKIDVKPAGKPAGKQKGKKAQKKPKPKRNFKRKEDNGGTYDKEGRYMSKAEKARSGRAMAGTSGGKGAERAIKNLVDESRNADSWVRGLVNPFGAGIGQRLPDASCMLPTYTMPMYSRGTLNAVVPSLSTTTTEVAVTLYPDPYFAFSQLVSETTGGAWSVCTATGTTAAQPSNLSVLTASCALYRVVSCGIHIYNDSAVQSRGGTFQVANYYASQFYGGGVGGFSGITPAILGSMTQTVKGDAAALGGDGLRFNWLPTTDRESLVPYSPGTLGLTGNTWKSPAYTTNTSGVLNSAMADSVLFFRAVTNANATTALSLQYEIVWNVEFIPLAATEVSYPGKIVIGSESASVAAAESLEAAGSKSIGLMLQLPGMSEKMERGGVPQGTASPTPVTAGGGGVLGKVEQIGKMAMGAFDFASGLGLIKHRYACYANRLDLSPYSWVEKSHHNAVVRKVPKRPFIHSLAHELPLENWLHWFVAQYALDPRDPRRTHPDGARVVWPSGTSGLVPDEGDERSTDSTYIVAGHASRLAGDGGYGARVRTLTPGSRP